MGFFVLMLMKNRWYLIKHKGSGCVKNINGIISFHKVENSTDLK